VWVELLGGIVKIYRLAEHYSVNWNVCESVVSVGNFVCVRVWLVLGIVCVRVRAGMVNVGNFVCVCECGYCWEFCVCESVVSVGNFVCVCACTQVWLVLGILCV
jgi:hypothetical protein